MTWQGRLFLAVLLLDAVVLAVVELLFLPLRFDGYLLPDLDGFPFPVTAVLAGLTMPWLASMAKGLSDRLAVAVAPLLVWLASLGVFGLAGPGGDLVLLQDWRSLLLLAAGALPTAIVLGGPPPRAAGK